MKTWMIAGVLVLSTLTLAPTAQAGTSCSVSTAPGDETCAFNCVEGDTLSVSASASDGRVGVSGSCGGKSAGCTTEPEKGCSKKASATGTGEGICQISKASWGPDKGTATCSASGTGDGGRPGCIVGIICPPKPPSGGSGGAGVPRIPKACPTGAAVPDSFGELC